MKKLLLGFIFIYCTLNGLSQVNRFLLSPDIDSINSSRVFSDTISNQLIFSLNTGYNASVIIKTDLIGNVIACDKFPEKISSLITNRCSDRGFFFHSGRRIIKTDSLLQVQWVKAITDPANFFLLGKTFERNNYYYVSASTVTSLFSPNFIVTSASIIFKFDSTGTLIDQVIFADTSGVSGQLYINLIDYNVSDDGSLYVGLAAYPWFAGGTCNYAPVTLKLDNSLNVIWSKTYGTGYHNSGMLLLPLNDGNILLAGSTSYNPSYCKNYNTILKKIDGNGNILFQRLFRHDIPEESLRGVTELNDRSLFMNSTFFDSTLNKNTSYLMRIDSSGNQIASMKLDVKLPPLMTHGVSSINGTIPLVVTISPDTLLLSTTNQNLSFQCHDLINQMYDSIMTIQPSSYNIPTINYSFNFIDSVFSNSFPIYATSVDACLTTSLENILNAEPEIIIYPNPTASAFTVSLSNSKIINGELMIFELTGREIYWEKYNGNTSNIHHNLVPGVYILKLTGEGNIFSTKLIIY